VQCASVDVSDVDDPAELRAEAAADAIASGQPAPDVGTSADAIHRAVVTNGGTFDTAAYSPNHAATGAVCDPLGAHIELEFTANDLVESTKIGMIQSVKAMKSSTPAGAHDTVATGVGDPEEHQLIQGAGETDPGREIDRAVHPGGRDLPNTSPIYGVHNSPGHMAGSLTEGTPTTGTSQWGSHTKDPTTHAFLPAVPARIDDTPGRSIEFAGQTYEHTFESTAIALEGPIAPNTYLGSVSWGWRSDAAGHVTLDPVTIVEAGVPSEAFMASADRWNAATFHDTSFGPLARFMGLGAADPVDIPTTLLTAGNVAAPNLSTRDLLNHLLIATMQIGALQQFAAAGDTGLVNKEFEKLALETELKKRKLKVSVKVNETEDWGADEVYVKVTSGAGTKTTPTHDLDNGDAFDFLLPLEDLLPLEGPLKIRVYDEDWPDSDDEIVEMEFGPPWDPARNAASKDGASYDVTATFDR
jgi:hypothetical protein